MNKITGLTIITQIGTKSYYVGKEYNGLLLAEINDNTVDSDIAYCPTFYGVTKDRQKVFEVINAPLELEYSSS